MPEATGLEERNPSGWKRAALGIGVEAPLVGTMALVPSFAAGPATRTGELADFNHEVSCP